MCQFMHQCTVYKTAIVDVCLGVGDESQTAGEESQVESMIKEYLKEIEDLRFSFFYPFRSATQAMSVCPSVGLYALPFSWSLFPFIRLSVRLSVHPSVCSSSPLFIRLSYVLFIRLFVHPVCLFIRLCSSVCVHPSVCSSICLFLRLSVHPSLCSSRLFIHQFVHPSVCLFVCLFICLSFPLFIHQFVHPSVCSSFCPSLCSSRLSVHPSVCSSFCLFLRLSVPPSLCPSRPCVFIRMSIHPLSVCPFLCSSLPLFTPPSVHPSLCPSPPSVHPVTLFIPGSVYLSVYVVTEYMSLMRYSCTYFRGQLLQSESLAHHQPPSPFRRVSGDLPNITAIRDASSVTSPLSPSLNMFQFGTPKQESLETVLKEAKKDVEKDMEKLKERETKLKAMGKP